jgi:hypothetical protein
MNEYVGEKSGINQMEPRDITSSEVTQVIWR